MSLPSSTVSPRPSTPPTTSATILPQHQVALRPTTTATYSHRHLLCSTSGALRSRRERLRRRRREIVGLLVVGGVLSSLALCLLALIVVFKNRPIVVLPAEVSPSPELVRRVFERNESILLPVESVRVKRDFMFVSDANATDPQCFEQCDAAYRVHLKEALQLNDAADFYDFPFHPALLERAAHIRYCDVVAARNKCYSDKCNDLATDAVFSPGNFLCSFKRAAFVDVLPCLAEAEPIAFLKCDRPCQTQTRAAAEKQQQMRNSTAVLTTICLNRRKILKNELKRVIAAKEHCVTIENGQIVVQKWTGISIFSGSAERAAYSAQIDRLCTFMQCYMDCVEPVLTEVCSPPVSGAPAADGIAATDLLGAYVRWHAADLADWHAAAERGAELPASCARLAGPTDPVIQLITRA